MFSTRLVLPGLLALLLLATLARADLEVELPLGGGAMATLSDPSHVDRWGLRIPGGSVLSVTLKGMKPKGGERPGLSIRLLDGDGAEVAAGTSTKSGAKLKKVPIGRSGVYYVEVTLSGTTTGDYQIKAKWKAPKKQPFAPTLTGLEVEVPFVADTGGTATLSVKGKKGVTPALVRIESADGSFTLDLEPPAAGAKKHKVKSVTLGTGGDYVLFVAGTGGVAKGTVKVKPPPKPKGLFEITEEVVDPEGTGDTFARGSVIGPAGGRVEVRDDGADLSGSAVDIPSGALTTLVPVLVGRGAEIPPADDEEIGTGPTVRFGPAGLTFGKDSRVEIPFDPEPFGGDFTGLKVVQREADGTKTIVPPAGYVVDVEQKRVSFPVKHFTSFRAFAPADSGELPPPDEIFSEDFESGWGFWWASNGIWEIGEPTSGPKAAYTGNGLAATVLGGNYPDDTGSSLVSPSFVLPEIEMEQEIQLRFWHWYWIHWDHDDIRIGVQQEVSPGNWSGTTTVSTLSRWSGVWTQHMADLSAFAGKKVRLLFFITQDTWYGGVGAGWYLDDVSVTVRTFRDMSDGKEVRWDFENGFEDWWGSGAFWEVGAPTSGPGAAHAGDSCAATVLTGSYADDTWGTLVSPSIVLPAIAPGEELHFRFWHWFSIHWDHDSGVLKVQEETSRGTWSSKKTLATYTRDSGVWSYPLLDISDFAGKKVRFIFALSQDPWYGGTAAGWYIDEVVILKR